jgi:cell division cycle 2-like protein
MCPHASAPPFRPLGCLRHDRCHVALRGQGTYGVVYRARCRTTERVVALKQARSPPSAAPQARAARPGGACGPSAGPSAELADGLWAQVKLERAREGFPLTALRELTVLLGLKHVNIVEVIEVVVSPKKQVFMVMEFMEHDFRALMESMKTPFRTGQVKCLMKQLLAGVEFMHRHWVIHRDLKTSNLLLDNQGNLKVCDFGLARNYSDPIKLMTPEVVTLWYRAPELLYGSKEYSIAIDMWSVGCIFAEFLLKEPIMKGKTEQDQRDKISELLGTPDEDRWPAFKDLPYAKGVRFKKKPCVLREKLPKVSYTGGPSLSDCGYELLQKMLCFNPAQRIAAHEVPARRPGGAEVLKM